MKKIKLFLIMAVTALAFTLTACGGSTSKPDYGSGSNGNNGDDSEYETDLPGLVTDGEYVSFGEWPQTIKASSVTINEAETRQAGAYTYYKGSDGAWYAKCLEMAYRDNSCYSNGNNANRKEAYCERYFKVEPIKWRVLTHDYNGTGKALLLANKALINCAFYEESRVRKGLEEDTPYAQERHNVDGSDYMHSRVRAFLNGKLYYVNEDMMMDHNDDIKLENYEFVDLGFLQTAFTEEEQDYIAVTSIVNDAVNANPASNPTRYEEGNNKYASTETLEDKIFLLSLKEATDTEYGFVGSPNSWNDYAQIIYPTDFAIANGTYTMSEKDDYSFYNPNYGTEWMLRSPATYSSSIDIILEQGFSSTTSTFNTSIGVVPALCIDLSHCTSVEGDVHANIGKPDPDEAGIPLEETILEFHGTPYEECGTQVINNKEYKLVRFGDFPQSAKFTAVVINEKIQAKMGDYTYYLGNDSCWYASLGSYEHDDYFKVEPIVWRVLTEDYDHDNDDSTPGKKLLLATNILMNRSYYDFYNVNRTINGKTVYPNNYEHSRIRAYLNGYSYLAKTPDEDATQSLLDIEWNYDEEFNCKEFENKGFLNTAFTSSLQDLIAVTQVDNSLASTISCHSEDRMEAPAAKYICPDTYDKVFLLSESEVTDPNYGFERAKIGIDERHDITTSARALCLTAFTYYNHLSMDGNYLSGTGIWNLRSPSGDGDEDDLGSGFCDVYYSGVATGHDVSGFGELFETHAGVVPAICLE